MVFRPAVLPGSLVMILILTGVPQRYKESGAKGFTAIIYCSLAYSALACFRIGMSGSATFHRTRKSWRIRGVGLGAGGDGGGGGSGVPGGQVVGTSGTRGGSFHAFFNVISERPPRPHLFGTGLLLDVSATHPLQGGALHIKSQEWHIPLL